MGNARQRAMIAGLLLSISMFGVLTMLVGVWAQTTRPTSVQYGETSIDEQPGVVPNPEAERLAGPYQSQPVFLRSTEPSGAIIVNTLERFLYLVQGSNRALRYGIGSGVMASSGRVA